MSDGVSTANILDELQHNTAAVAFKGSSFVLSAGFLISALRGGALLASMVASLPVWQGFDPLPVLAAKKKVTKGKGDESDTPREFDWQEERIRRLFNRMDSGS
jgi:hypothetical protein